MNTSNVYYIMERMGNEATEANAIEMLTILDCNNLSVSDISDIPSDVWDAWCSMAVASNN